MRLNRICVLILLMIFPLTSFCNKPPVIEVLVNGFDKVTFDSDKGNYTVYSAVYTKNGVESGGVEDWEWSLDSEYSKVLIDSDTGKLDILPEANDTTVTVQVYSKTLGKGGGKSVSIVKENTSSGEPDATYTFKGLRDSAIIRQAEDFRITLPSVTVESSTGEALGEMFLRWDVEENLNAYVKSFNEDGTVDFSKDVPLGDYKITVSLVKDSSVYKEVTLKVVDENFDSISNIEVSKSDFDSHVIDISFDYIDVLDDSTKIMVGSYPEGYREMMVLCDVVSPENRVNTRSWIFPETIVCEAGDTIPYVAEVLVCEDEGKNTNIIKQYKKNFGWKVPEPNVKIEKFVMEGEALVLELSSMVMPDGSQLIKGEGENKIALFVVLDSKKLREGYEANPNLIDNIEEGIVASGYLKENGKTVFEKSGVIDESGDYFIAFAVGEEYALVANPNFGKYTIEMDDMEVYKQDSDFDVVPPNIYVKNSKGEIVVKQLKCRPDKDLYKYIISFNEDGTIRTSKDIVSGTYDVRVFLSENPEIFTDIKVVVRERDDSSDDDDDDRDYCRDNDEKTDENKIDSSKIENMIKATKEDKIRIDLKDNVTKSVTSLALADINEVVDSEKGIELGNKTVSLEIGKDLLDKGSEKIKKMIENLGIDSEKAEVKVAFDKVSESEIKTQATSRNITALAAAKIEIKVGDGEKEEALTELDSPIMMKLNFDPAKVSDKENVNIFVKGLDGKLHYLRDGKIDLEKGVAEFEVKTLIDDEYAVIENKVDFADIQDDPQKKYIESVAAKGILADSGTINFMPDGSLTRAEFAKAAVKTLGLDINVREVGSIPFSDVDPNRSDYKYIAIAEENGLVNGFGDGSFRPNQALNKEEMVGIIMNSFKFENPDLEAQPLKDLQGFKDQNEISDWAIDAMIQAKELGILDEIAGDELTPFKGVKRSESALAIYNLIKVLG